MTEPQTRSTRGFTLIELVVSLALGTLVLLIVGSLFVSSLNAESSVRDSARSSNSGQLIADSFTHDVRAARRLVVETPFAGSCLLRAELVDDPLTAPGSVRFAAWYFGNGEIRSRHLATPIPVPVTAADVSGWTLLADEVDPLGTTPVFTPNDFGADLTFQVAGGNGTAVLIQTTARSRQPIPTASPSPSPVGTPCL